MPFNSIVWAFPMPTLSATRERRHHPHTHLFFFYPVASGCTFYFALCHAGLRVRAFIHLDLRYVYHFQPQREGGSVQRGSRRSALCIPRKNVRVLSPLLCLTATWPSPRLYDLHSGVTTQPTDYKREKLLLFVWYFGTQCLFCVCVEGNSILSGLCVCLWRLPVCDVPGWTPAGSAWIQ